MKPIKQVKSYCLLKEIGEGSNAKVYLGFCEKRKKLVAVKGIPTSKLRNKRVLEYMKRELALLHKLKHPNMMSIIGNEKTPNNVYIVSEYCNGGNLAELLDFFLTKKKCPMPEYLAQNIIRQVTLGLNFMHRKNAIHRDIKLENILINFKEIPNIKDNIGQLLNLDYSKMDFTRMDVKIADFGYSREFEAGEIGSSICGTPITMAPDLFKNYDGSGVVAYNDKIDLWSLGAVTYELLVGNPPFISTSIGGLVQKILKGEYEFPKRLKVSVQALRFINGLLQVDPNKRLDWKEIMNDDFIQNDYDSLDLVNLAANEELLKEGKLQMNTKELNDNLWAMFKPKEQIIVEDQEMFTVSMINKTNEGKIKINAKRKEIVEEKEAIQEENTNKYSKTQVGCSDMNINDPMEDLEVAFENGKQEMEEPSKQETKEPIKQDPEESSKQIEDTVYEQTDEIKDQVMPLEDKEEVEQSMQRLKELKLSEFDDQIEKEEPTDFQESDIQKTVVQDKEVMKMIDMVRMSYIEGNYYDDPVEEKEELQDDDDDWEVVSTSSLIPIENKVGPAKIGFNYVENYNS